MYIVADSEGTHASHSEISYHTCSARWYFINSAKWCAHAHTVLKWHDRVFPTTGRYKMYIYTSVHICIREKKKEIFISIRTFSDILTRLVRRPFAIPTRKHCAAGTPKVIYQMHSCKHRRLSSTSVFQRDPTDGKERPEKKKHNFYNYILFQQQANEFL